MRIWKWWPVFLLVTLTPVAYAFNPDAIITPALRLKGFQNLTILMISGTAGTVEMFLWYIGWGGVGDLVASWFEEDVNFAKKVAGEMKREGYLDWIKIHFTRRYQKLCNKASTIKKGLKAGGYVAFFWLGVWPVWGPRVIGDFICGTAKWRGCFIALCAGNLVKTSGFVFAWHWIFSLFGW